MKTYLTISFEPGFTTCIQRARRLTDAEQQDYAEWFRELAFVAVGDYVRLPHVTMLDKPDRQSDGSFIGAGSQVYIIDNDEMAYYISLNDARQADQDANDLMEYAESLRRRIEAAERQIDLPTKEEAKRRMQAYNDLQNEGGDGYVPYIYSKDEYDAMKTRYEEVQNKI